jgi:hypothetical protein
MSSAPESNLQLLRHTLAALAYRAARALENAPDTFATFDGAGRTPLQILSHMGDLFDWSLSMVQGNQSWHNSSPQGWDEEKRRFFTTLGAFDAYLVSGQPIHAPLERLLQGPVADALTHVGQLAMLRRLAACPMRGENYFVAEVAVGQISPDLPPAVKPFQ